MRQNTKISLLISAVTLSLCGSYSGNVTAKDQVSIPAGTFTPLYGLQKDQKGFKVKAFTMDPTAVTKTEFAEFIRHSPDWRPDHVKRLFAEERYLQDWEKKPGRVRPKKSEALFPVVNVSYFAAQAYCLHKKGRLPSTLEWEYVGAASEKKADASKDPEFAAQILAWYSSPKAMREVGRSHPNLYGIYDMHALVWEWTGDYNSSFVTADNRQDGEQTKDFFCGNSATGAENREAYAAFMRYAMRGTLGPSFTIEKLGFRCAYDQK